MPILELLDDEPLSSLQLNKSSKKEYSELTEEEQTGLFDYISSQVANDKEAFERLALLFLETTTQDDFNTVKVQPQPGFVFKTQVVSTKNKKYPVHTSVYINICYANAIPAPPETTEQELLKAIRGESQTNYKIPISLGQERHDQDSLIMDACLHTTAYVKSEKDLDYRLYVLEVAMEYIEDMISIQLSREFTMPNIKSKGQIPSRVLRLPKPSLMTAVKNNIQLPWKLKPIFTMTTNDLLTIRIPMPDKNVTLWTIDVLKDKAILTIDNKPMDIQLPCLIDIKDDTLTRVDFYKKSQDLIIILKSVMRTQYL